MMGKKEEKRVLQRIFARAIGIKSVVYILGFVFSTTWIASIVYDGLKDICGKNTTYLVLGLFSIVILIILFNYLLKLENEFSSDDVIDINFEQEKPKKVLVLFLSNIKDEIYNTIPLDNDIPSIEEWLDIKFNPWKMPYTSINRHKSTLEKVYVLTSPESSKQFNQFKKMIKQSHKRNFDIKEMLVTDINDIDTYNRIMNKIYIDNKSEKEENIVIDVTSGIKLYSIAGSYFALSSQKIIQYINTNDYKVYQFNNKILSDD